MQASYAVPHRRALLTAIALLAMLAVSVVNGVRAVMAAPTELFFSEYIEGSSNNKALEIYNGTGAAINLGTAGYNVQMFFNGSATAGLTINLVGTVANGDVFVLAQGSANATILAQADQTNGAGWFNGDDAVVLRKGTTIIDVIGLIGVDPGAEWGSGLASTADNTLRRKNAVEAGDTNGANAFDPAAEWDGFAIDSFAGLGVRSGEQDSAAPSVASTNLANVTPTSNLTIDFSEPVNVSGAWYDIACASSGVHTTMVTGGPVSFALDPDQDFVHNESCTLTVFAAQVADQDPNDPPDQMVADFSAPFTPNNVACTTAYTPIPSIQGSGASAAITGNVTTQGVVVGDFEGTTALSGFYLQDAAGDGDAATSDGIFVFTGSGNLVSAGQVVRVTGFARERFNMTALNGSNSNNAAVPASNVVNCGSGAVTPVDVTLPFDSATAPERFEGMLVRLPQALVISEYFNYDRFGELVLALPLDGETRPFTPTSIDEPGAPALERAAANSLRRIMLDDGLSIQNPPSIRHPNGSSFALDNRFRGGDTVQNTVGVLSFDFSLYRIQPTGPAEYTAVNPRPLAPEDVGGELRAAAMNTLNYFLTLNDPNTTADNICGGNANLECRGANSDQPAEFSRQRVKLLQALAGLNADIIGLNELENTPGIDPAADIAAGLNDLLGAGTYAAIETGVIGTDAIRVGLIYKPGKVTPVGSFDTLTTAEDPRFIDTRSRPPLAQTFESVADESRFTVVVNHLKSKGSACADIGDPDAGDSQGNCNATRTQAAQAIVDWLATDPTGSGDPDFLIMGDLNAYAKEDPIDAFLAGADDTLGTADDYTNLIALHQGPYAYSYTFDGQAGYLDHALASASMVGQVTKAADWHINSDEPDVLDYDTSFKPAQQEALYEENAYRTSDHDPVVVGLNLNAPPVVDAGGPYSVVEGGSVQVSATGSDPDGDTVTYAWDLDDNGSFETPGQTATFSAAALSAPGTHTIAVQATAVGGSAIDTATVNVIFNFTGFFSPVSNPPTLNQRNAGAAVPVKFSLGGDQGLGVLAAGYPRSVPIDCATGAALDSAVPTNSNDGLTYSGGEYSYVWKTEKAWAGTCRQLVVVLSDGTTHTANFRFK